jgi:hypothetical protein
LYLTDSYTDVYTSYFCATTSGSTISADETHSTTTAVTYQISSITKISTSQTTVTIRLGEPSSSTDPGNVSQGTSDNTTDVPKNTTSTGQSSSGTNATAIGGGVGGGAAAVAVVGIIVYLVHRKRKQREEKVSEIAN